MAINTVMQLRRELVDQIQALLPEIGINDSRFQKPNCPFTIPKSGMWLRLSTNDIGATDQEATGAIRTVTGIATVDIFTPRNKGDQVAHDAAEVIRSNLSNSYYSDTLRLNQGAILEDAEPNWYKVQVQFSYTYEGLTNGS